LGEVKVETMEEARVLMAFVKSGRKELWLLFLLLSSRLCPAAKYEVEAEAGEEENEDEDGNGR
jgi:hypothetical protein